jgi:hypothetical protein
MSALEGMQGRCNNSISTPRSELEERTGTSQKCYKEGVTNNYMYSQIIIEVWQEPELGVTEDLKDEPSFGVLLLLESFLRHFVVR